MIALEEWVARARADLAALDVATVQDSGILPSRGDQFFPVIGYPPVTMFRDMDEGPLFANFAQRAPSPISAYVHIPFCPSRCTFCHWITKTKSPQEEVEDYLRYLDREMALFKRKMGVDRIPVRSILFGGGTPTYLDADQTERCLRSFTSHFDLSECTQFSVEAEPRTLLGEDGLAKLRVLKAFGVDRISMGVQSVDDDILTYMGRVHTHQDTVDAIAQIRKAGISSIMIDLIYGYPNQTPETWARNMLTAVNLDLDGFQLYRLRVKQHGDRQGKIIKVLSHSPERFPSTSDVYLMKSLGKLIAKEYGFLEHQARCFTRDPDRLSHYLRDWTSSLYDVVGVGVSSWTNLRGVFALNVGDTHLENYYGLIDAGKVSVNRGKVRTPADELRRSLILPLKNMRVDKAAYRQRTGVEVRDYFATEIDWLKGMGLMAEDATAVWLTDRGRFFADEVTTQFFDPEFLPFPDVARPPARARL